MGESVSGLEWAEVGGRRRKWLRGKVGALGQSWGSGRGTGGVNRRQRAGWQEMEGEAGHARLRPEQLVDRSPCRRLGRARGAGGSEGLRLTKEGTVLDGPAVGVEALLQRPGEGGLGGQGVVDGEDGGAQLLGPALEIRLMGFGGLGHEAAAMDVHYQAP